MSNDEHQRAIDIITEATAMLEKANSSPEDRETQLSSYRSLHTKIDEVARSIPRSSNKRRATSDFIVDIIKRV